MAFVSQTLTTSWILICYDKQYITFKNVGQSGIYVTTTTTNVAPINSSVGLFYAASQGEVKLPIADINAGNYLWARSVSNTSKIVFDTFSVGKTNASLEKIASTGVLVDNFNSKLREVFSSFPGDNWEVINKAANDIIYVDGNTAGSRYLVVSPDPLTADSNTVIESVDSYTFPFELSFGFHNQRLIGQECMLGVRAVETPDINPSDLVIASISQTTTTLSVTTTTAHNLKIGQKIGIANCSNSRMNYPVLYVNSITSATQFTVTSTATGTIPSVTAGPFTSGIVYVLPILDGYKNGTCMIFNSTTATSAACYVNGGSFLPISSGTLNASHNITVGTTASVASATGVGNYSYRPSNEFKVNLFSDKVQWVDSALDTLSENSNRFTATQVCPNPDLSYKIRMKFSNLKSLSVPVAEILSVSKSGTTTATVVTKTAHGLNTGDIIGINGVRDITNFANLTASTIVSIVNATTFTLTWGSAVTATSYGGFVSRTNGGNPMGNISTMNVQTISKTNGYVTAVASSNWTGFNIGDYINLYGISDSNGLSVGLNGAYRVYNINGSSVVLENINPSDPLGSDVASTNVGGALIKRSDYRFSFIRIFDFNRLRVEPLSRPGNDAASSFPVVVKNTVNATISGTAAEDSAASGNPMMMAGMVRTSTSPTSLVASDVVRMTATTSGALTTMPFAVVDVMWQYTGVLTTNTSTAVKAAGAASIRNYVTSIQFQNTNATSSIISILDGATVIAQFQATANMITPACISFDVPLRGTAATALNIQCTTTGANVLVNVQGFQAM